MAYLVGEKLVAFVRAADRVPELAQELPHFVEKVKTVFEPDEIRAYLARRPRGRPKKDNIPIGRLRELLLHKSRPS